MGLRLGFVPGQWRESFWWMDSAVDWDATSEQDRIAYMLDGDRAHLQLRAENGQKEEPTRIRFRAMTSQELATARGLIVDWSPKREDESDEDFLRRVKGEVNMDLLHHYAFRVGVEFPTLPAARKIRERGLLVLPREFVDALAANYGHRFIDFYGGLVLGASSLTQQDKSPPPGDGGAGRMVGSRDAT